MSHGLEKLEVSDTYSNASQHTGTFRPQSFNLNSLQKCSLKTLHCAHYKNTEKHPNNLFVHVIGQN